MTNSTTTQIVFTDEDMRNLARRLFSNEVQGSRLDLEAYDADTTRQAFWAEQAEKYVDGWLTLRRAAGESIDFRRVRAVHQIPFNPNPLLAPIQEQAAELFQDSGYTWTGGLMVRKLKGEDIGEEEDMEFLYFQGKSADGDITWMDANGMDELDQDDIDGFIAGE